MGHRTGDNAQVLALGEALGWPFEVKRFVYAPYEKLVNLPWLSTLAGVVKDRSSPLQPPWPDIVITAGRRNEPIARWIRRQSGDFTRLVHLGRPWAAIERWDLVVTTPQYQLPRRPNVLHNQTPLHRVTPDRLAEEAAAWEPRLPALPRPRVAVLAGGPSGPYPFDASSGARLGREASALASRRGGSLLVTTSARTPPATADALFGAITVPAYLYRWTPDAIGNPYYGLLALADEIVVTADSISMMTEACATRKRVHLFDTGLGRYSMREEVEPPASPLWTRLDRTHLKAFVYRQTMRIGPQRLTRDIRIIQHDLLASGRATWLGEDAPPRETPPLEDVARAVARVRRLMAESAHHVAGEAQPAGEAKQPIAHS
jgi:mitochondrial fission protein ELM1